MRYYLRRNKFKIAGILILAFIAFLVFIPAPQANLNPSSSLSSLPLEHVCAETVRQAEEVYKVNNFIFISTIDIEGNEKFDKIDTFISIEYALISHLTSNEGCVIDATLIDFTEAL